MWCCSSTLRRVSNSAASSVAVDTSDATHQDAPPASVADDTPPVSENIDASPACGPDSPVPSPPTTAPPVCGSASPASGTASPVPSPPTTAPPVSGHVSPASGPASPVPSPPTTAPPSSTVQPTSHLDALPVSPRLRRPPLSPRPPPMFAPPRSTPEKQFSFFEFLDGASSWVSIFLSLPASSSLFFSLLLPLFSSPTSVCACPSSYRSLCHFVTRHVLLSFFRYVFVCVRLTHSLSMGADREHGRRGAPTARRRRRRRLWRRSLEQLTEVAEPAVERCVGVGAKAPSPSCR